MAMQFKDTLAATTSDNYIRDAFVAGILSQPTRLRLLESKELTLQETIDLADSMEGAVRDMEAYASTSHPGHTEEAVAYERTSRVRCPKAVR